MIGRILATVAFISMFSGALYAFAMISGLLDFHNFNLAIFFALWIGPVAIAAPFLFVYLVWIDR
jgi:hypothetical protein